MTPDPEDRPPLAGTWNQLYALVLGLLLVCIVLFRIFGRWFS